MHVCELHFWKGEAELAGRINSWKCTGSWLQLPARARAELDTPILFWRGVWIYLCMTFLKGLGNIVQMRDSGAKVVTSMLDV